jgi:hypothetical protein
VVSLRPIQYEPFSLHRIPGHSHDNTSSIYSRSTDTAKDAIPMTTIPTTLQIKPSLPEINLLDHQISMARGSTMASKTTRPRMRKSKTTRDVGFQQIVSTTMDATQSLALQYHFDPANSPSGDPCLIRAIVSVRVALDTSRTEETSAEQEWKQQWKVCSRNLRVLYKSNIRIYAMYSSISATAERRCSSPCAWRCRDKPTTPKNF